MRFVQLDVFAERAYGGNPLAVFLEAGSLRADQMQLIASELNLSETTFVTGVEGDAYDVRIFTPVVEVPFAGHPTIGTAWALRAAGAIESECFLQRSAAGDTTVRADGDLLWLERPGASSSDIGHDAVADLAGALVLDTGDLQLPAEAFGGEGALAPAHADAGVEQLQVPVVDVDALERISLRPEALLEVTPIGAYCFTWSEGTVRARGFMPGLGVREDPATGSAAAGLGLYLGDRVGEVEVEVIQGVEMNRPSRLHLRGAPGRAAVGGRCEIVLEGELRALP